MRNFKLFFDLQLVDELIISIKPMGAIKKAVTKRKFSTEAKIIIDGCNNFNVDYNARNRFT